MSPEEIFKDPKRIKRAFYRWLYDLKIAPSSKWKDTTANESFGYSTAGMREWHQHVDPVKFAASAANYGYDYRTCIKVVGDLCAKKKMEDLLR